jgi:penicillin G amidase
MKKAIGYILVIALILVVVGYFAIYHFNARALPDYRKPMSLPGLSAKVEVYRDSFAIPHVYADNEEDLYQVVGYLTAQDRLWQMDLLRRVTTGRLSEIFGKDMIKTDMLMRALQITEKSKRIISHTDPSVLKAIQAYANGVNKYIKDNYEKLPIEFAILGYNPDPWKIEDSFNLIGYIAWDLNGAWNAEIVLHKLESKLSHGQLVDLIPGFDAGQSTVYTAKTGSELDWRSVLIDASSKIEDLGLEVFHGSNNWVVSGSKTVSGKPILANDMHLSFSAPGIWYQVHEVVPGKLDVTGVLLPGQPFVISGHNQKIAWGLTNVMNDDIDFYRETINPSDSNQYKLDGKWIPFRIKHENIAVKKSDTVRYDFRFTHRGPVISMLKGVSEEVISMRWMGNESGNEVQSIYRLNRAKNWIGFCNAMKTFVSISQNVAYADDEGNIGMYCCAGIPVRRGNPTEVQEGDTSANDWKGLVPFEELPHKFNPKEGFAVSANNRTADSTYQHYISRWFDLSFRYDRISELLRVDKKLSVSDIAAIQTDETSNLASLYLPGLLDIVKKKTDWSTTAKQSLKALTSWKYQMSASSSPAALFEVFYNRIVENLVKDELGQVLYPEFLNDKILVRNMFHNVWRNRKSVLCDNVLTVNKIETYDDIVLKSFGESVAWLIQKLGSDQEKWEWGKIHRFTLSHPLGKVNLLNRVFELNRGPFEAGGSFHTVAPYSYKFTDQFNVTSGASQRHIYDFGDWDKSLSVIPSGNSGIPASPHYCDQTELYFEGKYHRDLFSFEAVVQNAKYKTTYMPQRINNK